MKCSLYGLEDREDLRFYTYPKDTLPPLENYVVLSMDSGPTLSEKDADYGLLLIDGTWKYAELMARSIPKNLPKRQLPSHFRTAYPRRQTLCPDPMRGLASVEALYIAHTLMGRNTEGLLDHYHWREPFLEIAHAFVTSHTQKRKIVYTSKDQPEPTIVDSLNTCGQNSAPVQ